MQANDFLQAYMAKNLGASGQGPLLAAQVLVPAIKGPDDVTGTRKYIDMDVPGVADDAKLRPIGLFGNKLAADHPAVEYGFTHQGLMDNIRGPKNFVPGGIPAPAGYDMDASKERFPAFFEGMKQGNVPAFYSGN